MIAAACPRLTELTIICSLDARNAAMKTLLDPDGMARARISELVTACNALPDFDALQIVYFPLSPRSLTCSCENLWCPRHPPSVDNDQALREYMKAVKGWAMECLERPNTRCQEGDRGKGSKLRNYVKAMKDWAIDDSKRPETGRKKTTLRVIELTREPLPSMSYQYPVKVEEYEM